MTFSDTVGGAVWQPARVPAATARRITLFALRMASSSELSLHSQEEGPAVNVVEARAGDPLAGDRQAVRNGIAAALGESIGAAHCAEIGADRITPRGGGDGRGLVEQIVDATAQLQHLGDVPVERQIE